MEIELSTQNREPALVREFRELYNYVYDVGKYVNLIYKRLEKIETMIEEVSLKFDERTTANRGDIGEILEKMLTKSEFNEFVEALRGNIEEKLPSLPTILDAVKEKPYQSRYTKIAEPPKPPREEKRQKSIFG
jgi:histone deacetylase complex regulatory component SIN3